VHNIYAHIRQPFVHLQYLENKHVSSIQELINKEQYFLLIIRERKVVEIYYRYLLFTVFVYI